MKPIIYNPDREYKPTQLSLYLSSISSRLKKNYKVDNHLIDHFVKTASYRGKSLAYRTECLSDIVNNIDAGDDTRYALTELSQVFGEWVNDDKRKIKNKQKVMRKSKRVFAKSENMLKLDYLRKSEYVNNSTTKTIDEYVDKDGLKLEVINAHLRTRKGNGFKYITLEDVARIRREKELKGQSQYFDRTSELIPHKSIFGGLFKKVAAAATILFVAGVLSYTALNRIYPVESVANSSVIESQYQPAVIEDKIPDPAKGCDKRINI